MRFKYRVKRECYTGPEPGREVVWHPDRVYDEGLGQGVVAFDIEPGGWVPPHHFEPLDGGPVQLEPCFAAKEGKR